MNFKEIDKKYRPMPFWSWNDKLIVDESVRQTELMDKAGMGGYFMHARGGLQTEYMGEEWFENVAACIEESNKRGMYAWAYDENGWPSGFGGGKVTEKGEKYWQKMLRVIPVTQDRSHIPEHRIIKITDTHCYYYDVNRFYVDLLDREVVADFINEIYLPYYERFGDSFQGYFTDEPQLDRNGIQWSLVLEDEYYKAYGESLTDVLPCLFFEEENFEDVRLKFWKLATELFSSSFMKQIYDWCTERNLKFTGHLLGENNHAFQLRCNGAAMPQYEYFSIPGIDWLGRTIGNFESLHQVSSAAAQTGKDTVLCETFGISGQSLTHDLLKRIFEWLMVRGINLLCQHLEGYSNRGLRKRDCPPTLYIQQPWWDNYKIFNDSVSRVGMLLREGKITFNTLIMHNITSGWICYNNRDNTYTNGKKIGHYYNALLEAIDILEKKHIPFHLGDEILIERHGHVEGNKFIIGKMSYDRIVIPEYIRFLPNTEKLLKEFEKNGGIITTANSLEANNIIDSEKISYTYREFDEFTMHYFVNSNDEHIKANISKGSYAINIEDGEKKDFYGEYTFAPYESLILIDDGTPHKEKPEERKLTDLDISGKWDVADKTMNSITLDKCTYYFDGELQEEDGYILNVVERANALEREVDIRCEFKVNIDSIPNKIYLGCETPDIFDIMINGERLDKTDCGYYRDISIRLIDIADKLKLGENIIETRVLLKQLEKTYESIRNARHFETERNKLCYDMEIEAMYLVGDFGVNCNGVFKDAPLDSCSFNGSFSVGDDIKSVELSNIEQKGFPFFCGEITFVRNYTLDHTDYKITFNKKGINVIKLKVNGRKVKTILWAPYEIDISEYLTVGENKIEITIINNLRNLFGPHHNAHGELWNVDNASFYKEDCVWTVYHEGGTPPPYTDNYSFVNTGIV